MSNAQQSEVRVLAKDGQVIFPSPNNPAYGYIQVAQTRVYKDGNFLKTRRLTAIIPGKIEDLREAGWKEGTLIGGRIVIKEQTIPFNDPDLDIKIAGKTGIPCKIGEDIIYRKHFWEVNSDAQDILLDHTNTEEIKAAYAAMSSPDGFGQV